MENQSESTDLSLNLSQLQAENHFCNYQRVWGEYRNTVPFQKESEDIDNLYECIFCKKPISPRSRYGVLRKRRLRRYTDGSSSTGSLHRNLGVTSITTAEAEVKDTSPDPVLIEYACGSCAPKIRSTVTSPRGAIKSPRTISQSPRDLKKTRSYTGAF